MSTTAIPDRFTTLPDEAGRVLIALAAASLAAIPLRRPARRGPPGRCGS